MIAVGGHKGAVELDDVDVDVLEHRERGLAGAKIVHVGREATGVQIRGQLIHGLGLSGIGGLGDLDVHEFGRQVVLGGERPHMLGDIAGKNVYARHIEGNRNHAKSSIEALAEPHGDALPNIFVERHYKAAFLECGDKRCGRNERAVLVNPAGECFGANNLAGFHIDLGLKIVRDATI